EVFAARAGKDGVAFLSQRVNDLEREQTDGAFRPAVNLCAALAITLHALNPDARAPHRQLWHAAVADADLRERRLLGHDSNRTSSAIQPSASRRRAMRPA